MGRLDRFRSAEDWLAETKTGRCRQWPRQRQECSDQDRCGQVDSPAMASQAASFANASTPN
jgi:hypothetical protein